MVAMLPALFFGPLVKATTRRIMKFHEQDPTKILKNNLIERTPKTIFKAFIGFEKPAKACFDAPKTITKV